MNKKIKNQLIDIAEKYYTKTDPSHDIEHALRVMRLAELIGKKEKADLDIIVPAAIFHDVVTYPKHSSKSKNEHKESAELTERMLKKINYFNKQQIILIKKCIEHCSFSLQHKHTFLEEKIIQDADALEVTGAISIMRTFASTGNWNRPFYNPDDPFCNKRKPDTKNFAVDLFYERLLKVEKRIYTKTAKKIAREKTSFLNIFLKQLQKEIFFK